MMCYAEHMTPTLSYASVQHNFSSGISLGEHFLDEATWNSLSAWAQEAMLELSKTSVEYMDSAIDTAISGDAWFPYLWKQTTLDSIQEQANADEKRDREIEQSTLLSLMI